MLGARRAFYLVPHSGWGNAVSSRAWCSAYRRKIIVAGVANARPGVAMTRLNNGLYLAHVVRKRASPLRANSNIEGKSGIPRACDGGL